MRYLRRRSGAGSERIGFQQSRLRGDKGWYTPPRNYKRVEAGPVKTVEKDTSSGLEPTSYDYGQAFKENSFSRNLFDLDFNIPFSKEGKEQFKKNNETNPYANFVMPF